MDYPDANTVVEIDGGQVAIGDSFIEILPHGIASGMYATQDEPISGLLWIVDDRTDAIETKLGEPLIQDRNDTLRISGQVTGIVYTLKCQKPSTDQSLKNKARQALSQQSVPSWVWAAYNTATVRYVGGTYRPDERMVEHMGLSGAFDGAKFTEIFPPTKITSLVLCLSDNVYEIEAIDGSFWDDDSTTFVYQA